MSDPVKASGHGSTAPGRRIRRRIVPPPRPALAAMSIFIVLAVVLAEWNDSLRPPITVRRDGTANVRVAPARRLLPGARSQRTAPASGMLAPLPSIGFFPVFHRDFTRASCSAGRRAGPGGAAGRGVVERPGEIRR